MGAGADRLQLELGIEGRDLEDADERHLQHVGDMLDCCLGDPPLLILRAHQQRDHGRLLALRRIFTDRRLRPGRVFIGEGEAVRLEGIVRETSDRHRTSTLEPVQHAMLRRVLSHDPQKASGQKPHQSPTKARFPQVLASRAANPRRVEQSGAEAPRSRPSARARGAVTNQRSTSPKTISSVPRIAETSASMWPRHSMSIACRCAKPGALILQRYGLLVPSATR